MLNSYLALDVGGARIGLALANDVARIAAPLVTLANDTTFVEQLTTLIAQHEVTALVVGWPRGLEGQDTNQTQYVADFVARLEAAVDVPIYHQDEAVTSVKAEAELKHRGGNFAKGDIDSLSAVYILEDYLAEAMR